MASQKTIIFPKRSYVFWALCILSVLPLLALLAFSDSWRWLLMLHLPPQLALIYSCIRPNCRWFGPVVTSFRANRKEVWLTFDDGPCVVQIPEILEVLEQFQARATFFVIGKRLEANVTAARAIIKAGHTIENHSATHPAGCFWAYFPKAAECEIKAGAHLIKSAVGTESRLFRAPVGMANYFVHSALRRQDKKLIGWSARGFDSCSEDANKIVQRIYRNVKPGAIILLHEQDCIVKRNDEGRAVLELLLTRLCKDGYSCVIPGFEPDILKRPGLISPCHDF